MNRTARIQGWLIVALLAFCAAWMVHRDTRQWNYSIVTVNELAMLKEIPRFNRQGYEIVGFHRAGKDELEFTQYELLLRR